MSWASTLTPSYVRSLIGNTDNSYDAELLTYINALVADLEYLTGIDFDFTNGPVIKTVRYQVHKNIFVLNGELAQIGPWQSITSVEKSKIEPNPTWQTLVLDSDYLTVTHKAKPYPIFQLESKCGYYTKYDQLRISGVYGFGDANNIPADILGVIGNFVQAYYQYLAGGATGTFAIREKSKTREIEYSDNNDLQSTELFTPARLKPLMDLAKKYNVYPTYPF